MNWTLLIIAAMVGIVGGILDEFGADINKKRRITRFVIKSIGRILILVAGSIIFAAA